MNELNDFLATKEFPGKLIFSKVWGSRSHNTHKEDSDWDFSGVYVAPTKSILGMRGGPETIQNKEGAEKPDFSFHEVGKFCNLLLIGNPGVLEMLFTEKLCNDSGPWRVIKEERKRFLTKNAVNQYVGYAEGQLKRLKNDAGLHTKGGSYNEKWAYHLVRLLIDAKRIISGGEPLVWKEGEEREHLMMIRSGNCTKEHVEGIATLHVDTVRAALKSSTLPEMGDRDFLEKWLVELRLACL